MLTPRYLVHHGNTSTAFTTFNTAWAFASTLTGAFTITFSSTDDY